MNMENNSKFKSSIAVETLAKGLSITLTRPECTDSGHWHHEPSNTGSKPV